MIAATLMTDIPIQKDREFTMKYGTFSDHFQFPFQKM
jgi:hypothetical protein